MQPALLARQKGRAPQRTCARSLSDRRSGSGDGDLCGQMSDSSTGSGWVQLYLLPQRPPVKVCLANGTDPPDNFQVSLRSFAALACRLSEAEAGAMNLKREWGSWREDANDQTADQVEANNNLVSGRNMAGALRKCSAFRNGRHAKSVRDLLANESPALARMFAMSEILSQVCSR